MPGTYWYTTSTSSFYEDLTPSSYFELYQCDYDGLIKKVEAPKVQPVVKAYDDDEII